MDQSQIITVVTSLLFGGGAGAGMVKLYVKNEARLALEYDLKEINSKLEKFHDEFVSCKFCTMQHDNLNNNLSSFRNDISELNGDVKKILEILTTR